MASGPVIDTAKKRSKRLRIARYIFGLLAAYLIVAYLLIPFAWERYAHRHPSFDDNPRLTRTGDDHPGDPLNVSLFGAKEQIEAIMNAARWES